MKNEIVLELQAQDLERTEYIGFENDVYCGCAIEKAVKRQEGVVGVELVDRTHINNEMYIHKEYSNETFKEDKMRSLGEKSTTVIRTLILTKI